MANVVQFYTVLRTSASWAISSTQLVTSSSSTCSRLPEYQRLELRSTGPIRSVRARPSSSFSTRRGAVCEAQNADIEDHKQVLAERNRLRDQLARRTKEIRKLKAIVDSALKDLSKVVNHLKATEEDENVQPITPPLKRTRDDVWGRRNGDDHGRPPKKSHPGT